MRRLLKKTQGQSIIELLIATAVFGLIVTPFLSSVLNLTAAQVRYRHRTQATHYAREAMEIAYNLVVNNPDFDNFVSTYGDGNVWHTYLDNGEYRLETGPSPLIDGKFLRGLVFIPVDGTLEVATTVTWQERNKTQDLALVTYLINLGEF